MDRKGKMVPTTRWSNIGLWIEPRSVHPSAGIKTPWGNLIIKRREDMLFSERYGYIPTRALGPFRLTWARLRRWTSQISP